MINDGLKDKSLHVIISNLLSPSDILFSFSYFAVSKETKLTLTYPMSSSVKITAISADTTGTIRYLHGDRHPDLLPRFRVILVDWLVDVAEGLHLPMGALHLGVTVMDRFMSHSSNPVSRTDFQKIGLVAVWLAAKFLTSKVLTAVECSRSTNNKYSAKEIARCESEMLKVLSYNVHRPRTAYAIGLETLQGQGATPELLHVYEYVATYALMCDSLLGISPVEVAAACVLTAREGLGGLPGILQTLIRETSTELRMDPRTQAIERCFSTKKKGKVALTTMVLGPQPTMLSIPAPIHTPHSC